jgi:hypothetical protein
VSAVAFGELRNSAILDGGGQDLFYVGIHLSRLLSHIFYAPKILVRSLADLFRRKLITTMKASPLGFTFLFLTPVVATLCGSATEGLTGLGEEIALTALGKLAIVEFSASVSYTSLPVGKLLVAWRLYLSKRSYDRLSHSILVSRVVKQVLRPTSRSSPPANSRLYSLTTLVF